MNLWAAERACALAALVAGLLGGVALSGCGRAPRDDPAAPVVTVDLAPPILRTGGVVIAFAHPVDPALFHGDVKTAVKVSDDFSYLFFDYPRDQDWTVTLQADPAVGRVKIASTALSVGTADYDDETGRRHPQTAYQVLYVVGPKVSEDEARRRDVYFQEVLMHGARCTPFRLARVCTPLDRSRNAERLDSETVRERPDTPGDSTGPA